MKRTKPDGLIGIAFSDLHSYKFKVFDKDGSRLEWTLKSLKEIAMQANELQVPLFFNGDLFHTPKDVDNECLWKTISTYKDYIEGPGTRFFAISGNHDMSEKNGLTHRSPSYLNTFAEVFKTFRLLDELDEPQKINTKTGKVFVWGLPYYNSDKELRTRIKQLKLIARSYDGYKILMLHNDCPGAMEANGIRLGETKALGKPEKLDGFFKDWDLVLFGHIHVPQKITKKCYMLGSPIHQNSADTTEMGYWQIFTNRAPKFIGLVGFPKFIKLTKGEVIMNLDSTIDYIIPYEEEGSVEELEKGDFHLGQTRKKLAKRYLKVKGIKDKKKARALINILNAVE